MARKTDYYDPFGNKQTGYVIDGKTYKDEAGTQRIDPGSAVTVGSKTWQMTDNGGVQVNPGVLPQAPANAAPMWYQQAQEILQQINNGRKFEFDVNGDELVRQAHDLRAGNAQRAMEDTMGQAAGLTGGYGSSYAQGVGQQAYNEEMRKLNDDVLDIYDRRLAGYNEDRADQYNRLSAAQGMYDRAYAEGRDKLSDERYADELAYARGRDAIADERYADELAYDKGRDTLGDDRYARETAYDRVMSMIEAGYMPTDEELAAGGVDKGFAQYYSTLIKQQMTANNGAKGGSDGYRYSPPDDTPPEDPGDPGSVPTAEPQKPDMSGLSSFGKSVFNSLGSGTYAYNPASGILNTYKSAVQNGIIGKEQAEKEKELLTAYLQWMEDYSKWAAAYGG